MAASSAAQLQYIHLKSWPRAARPYFPSYALATAIQTELQQKLFAWKDEAAAASRSSASSSSSDPDANVSDHLPLSVPPPPPPAVLCFTPMPTYTLGRRQTEPLGPNALERLQKRLTVRHDTFDDVRQIGFRQLRLHEEDPSDTGAEPLGAPRPEYGFSLEPVVTQSPRGGLTTYHGPGQLVFWPVLDLRSPLLPAPLSVRDYACLLEQTTIAALEKACGLKGFTTSNPGVWVTGWKSEAEMADPSYIAALIGELGQEGLGADWEGRTGEQGKEGESESESENENENENLGERKVAALGVHLRRHVTGLGVAINIAMPTTGGPTSPAHEAWNPWARIDACGLGDKGVTSVAAELLRPGGGDRKPMTHRQFTTYISSLQRSIGAAWVKEFAARLGLSGYKHTQPRWRFVHDETFLKNKPRGIDYAAIARKFKSGTW
ncbi:hypothetical protein SLS62_006962 [Diatrype stigma]|uniref:BPL/LPL catalytic domain-containing protein n=1 Tax=Diatrype stigma TaxID=117547 RepID=A0AAN9UPX6_9PEZI